MELVERFKKIKSSVPEGVDLIVVTKTQTVQKIMELYNLNYKVFGENKVQELVDKFNQLPKDIQWHMIGHLQGNKVKYIAPFISLIQSVDSVKLLQEINKEGQKNNRIIPCLLQIHIAQEVSKFGMKEDEAIHLLNSEILKKMKNISIHGLMGMASNTNNVNQIKVEFNTLYKFFDLLKEQSFPNTKMEMLSMGMTSDYKLALQEKSTMIRLGSIIFDSRS